MGKEAYQSINEFIDQIKRRGHLTFSILFLIIFVFVEMLCLIDFLEQSKISALN